MKIIDNTAVKMILIVVQIYVGLALLRIVPGYPGESTNFTNVLGIALIALAVFSMVAFWVLKLAFQNAVALDPKEVSEIKSLLKQGDRTHAIEEVRAKANVSWVEARHYVQKLEMNL